ncbi:MAG: hypothetical protein EXS07_06540 [Gemmataceae bacterium]|nr:hypothetical protein [Gemmataceae bacterium]
MNKAFRISSLFLISIMLIGNKGQVLAQNQKTPSAVVSNKKGLGCAESHGIGAKQLMELKVSWYYNWGDQTKITTDVNFIPMIFSPKRLGSTVFGEYILSFNEPDNEKQAKTSVTDSLKAWPMMISKGKLIGSPAMAGNPVTGDWFTTFMKTKPKIDFVAVHWYKGTDSKHFIKDMEELYAAYGKPIWVTEFAPQTASSSKQNPTKCSQTLVDKFIFTVTDWMEKTPYIHRYAWHDSRTGTSALFDEKGELTLTGKTYARVGGR